MRTLRSVTGTGVMIAATVLVSTVASAQNQDPRYHPQPNQPAQQTRDPRYHQDQQRRVDEERRRQTDYQRVLDQRMKASQAQQAQLQAERRTAQYAAQQRYYANLQAQRQQLQAQRNYNNDPYFTTAPAYSYRVGNTVRQTNQIGANVLKQAVNNGYDQGVQAGRADRQDRRPSSYRTSFGYTDANYGYNGQYVAQSDYNYYFREGFRRGYTDGYGSTSQFGSFNNGTGSILGNVLTGILGLTNLH